MRRRPSTIEIKNQLFQSKCGGLLTFSFEDAAQALSFVAAFLH